MEDNDAFLALAANSEPEVLSQVLALTRQSTHQQREIATLARLVLGRLESTGSAIF
ncbi:hypothetical protein [Streptomyces sp. NPDC051561]|uniref:hypothetical protein n=1 Tax=Streptomyces sp. NPDC051561 TaxID=3365658 RepID=UPI0037B99C8C